MNMGTKSVNYFDGDPWVRTLAKRGGDPRREDGGSEDALKAFPSNCSDLTSISSGRTHGSAGADLFLISSLASELSVADQGTVKYQLSRTVLDGGLASNAVGVRKYQGSPQGSETMSAPRRVDDKLHFDGREPSGPEHESLSLEDMEQHIVNCEMLLCNTPSKNGSTPEDMMIRTSSDMNSEKSSNSAAAKDGVDDNLTNTILTAWPPSPKKGKGRKELTSSSQAQNFSRSSSASRGGAASNAGHSSAWKAGSTKSEEARSETQYPVRPGLPDCQYYLKTGKCTYGARCKFNHPERDERDCFDFVQTGKCPYGRNCKYNHPTRKDMVFSGVNNEDTNAVSTTSEPSPRSPGHAGSSTRSHGQTLSPAKGASRNSSNSEGSHSPQSGKIFIPPPSPVANQAVSNPSMSPLPLSPARQTLVQSQTHPPGHTGSSPSRILPGGHQLGQVANCQSVLPTRQTPRSPGAYSNQSAGLSANPSNNAWGITGRGSSPTYQLLEQPQSTHSPFGRDPKTPFSLDPCQSGPNLSPESPGIGYLRGMNAFGFNTIGTAKENSSLEKEPAPFDPFRYKGRLQFQATNGENGMSFEDGASGPAIANMNSIFGSGSQWQQASNQGLRRGGRPHVGPGGVVGRPM